MIRVDVKPELYRWARRRAGVEIDSLVRRFPRYREWEAGRARPTLKQLEKLASATRAAVGFFFLSEPPEEPFPIADFRAIGGAPSGRPSVDLLDTIYLCQQRQDWYREFARMTGEEPLSFVGSASADSEIETVAANIRTALRLDLEERRALPTWTEALRRLVTQADAMGVLVMVSGIVGSNTRRPLDPKEFRGFALADRTAPLIFINGKDSKAAQMFTLAHELAHLWLGETGVSDSGPESRHDPGVEDWCNRVSAETLAPQAIMREEYRANEPLEDELARLARRFKVSTLVVLRRILDIGGLNRSGFQRAYDAELEKLKTIRASSGGDFYRTQTVRVGRRFAQAVVAGALEGNASFPEAFRLLGVRRMQTFNELARNLGVAF